MKVIMSLPAGRQRLEKLGMNLFGTSDPKETIHRLEAFFRQIGCPLKLHEVNITEHHHAEIVDTWQRNGAEGNNFKLGLEEYARLIEYAK
jgi:alcohol dehydrogenase YqhD (iron-dependent ADH family)